MMYRALLQLQFQNFRFDMNTNAWGRNRPGVSYVFEVYEYVIYKKIKNM